MNGFPILSLMLLVPLVGALACLFLDAKAARTVALVATLVDFVLATGGNRTAAQFTGVTPSGSSSR